MFLIDDDEAEIRERCKKSGTRTDHDVDLPVCRPFRLFIALTGRKPGIHDPDPVSESPVKAHHGLVSQGDLRDQNDRLSALPQDMIDEFHIDFRLSASRDPVEQIGISQSGIIVPDHSLCCPSLFLIQGNISRG